MFVPYILLRRKDLVLDSIMSGVLTMAIGTAVYFILYAAYPNFIEKFWYLPNFWFSKLILGIPVGEYIWYFLVGMFIGPLYEYLQSKKLQNINQQS